MASRSSRTIRFSSLLSREVASNWRRRSSSGPRSPSSKSRVSAMTLEGDGELAEDVEGGQAVELLRADPPFAAESRPLRGGTVRTLPAPVEVDADDSELVICAGTRNPFSRQIRRTRVPRSADARSAARFGPAGASAGGAAPPAPGPAAVAGVGWSGTVPALGTPWVPRPPAARARGGGCPGGGARLISFPGPPPSGWLCPGLGR